MSPRKTLAALLIALTPAGLACLPQPSDPIEYLQLDESVIVQTVTTLPSDVDERVAKECRVPEFTLYGDGTLLFQERDGGSTAELREATLDEEEIIDLLKSIDGEEFFVFPYNLEGGGAPSSTTFLYVHTKQAANAVSVSGLEREHDDESDEVRAMRNIAQRLGETVSGVEESRPFEAASALLTVRPVETEVDDAPEWEGPVELSSLTDGGLSRIEVRGQAGQQLLQEAAGDVRLVQEDGGVYAVCARPVLPYEENFPEFDAP